MNIYYLGIIHTHTFIHNNAITTHSTVSRTCACSGWVCSGRTSTQCLTALESSGTCRSSWQWADWWARSRTPACKCRRPAWRRRRSRRPAFRARPHENFRGLFDRRSRRIAAHWTGAATWQLQRQRVLCLLSLIIRVIIVRVNIPFYMPLDKEIVLFCRGCSCGNNGYCGSDKNKTFTCTS